MRRRPTPAPPSHPRGRRRRVSGSFLTRHLAHP
jgi:hypothetical protein